MKSIILTGAFMALVLTDLAASLQETAAKLQSEYGDAVVFVQATTESRGRQRDVEELGTVIDASGTVVVAHSRFTSNELEDVKLLLADGTEVPAKVVLTDPDLDIAFIVPDEEATAGEEIEFTPVPLTDTLIELQAADTVIILSREGEDFRRQSSVLTGQVETVLHAPRHYYRTDVRPSGAPAFDVHGHFIGIFARRVQGEKAHHRVILPGPNILKAAGNLPDKKRDAENEVAIDQPDLLKLAARKLAETYGEAIATVRIDVEIVIAVGEQSQTLEQTLDSPCTLINASGLGLVPDPTANIVSQIKSQIRGEVDVSVEAKQIKLLLGDGTEIPGKMIFQDSDLNLAFIQPDNDSDEADGVTYMPVKLDDRAELAVFEEVLALSRLGEDLNREVAVRSGRVASIQRRPRLFYRTEIVGIGAPVFNKDVKLVGFQVPSKDSTENQILPAAAILKSIEQFEQD